MLIYSLIKELLDFFKSKTALTAFLLSSCLILIVIYYLPIRFEENDDVVMLMLASGNYTGNFESNLIFINPIYGFIISSLYKINEDIEWYTLIFLSLHIISFSIIIYNVLIIRLKWFFKISLVLCLSLIELNLIMYLQFTTVAIILAIAGVLLFISDNKRLDIFSSILIVLSGLIRFEAALLILILMTPYFIYLILNSKTYNRLLQLLIIFLLILLPRFFSDLNLSQNWKEYSEFNSLRTKVNDNLNADYKESIYNGICSKEDYILLKKFFPDPSVIKTEILKDLIININSTKSYLMNISNITNQFLNYKHELLLLLFILGGMVLFKEIRGKEFVFLIIFICFLLFVLGYISIDSTLKNRVFIGFVISIITLLLIFIKKRGLSIKSQFVLTFCFFLFSIFYFRRLNEKIAETSYVQNLLFKQCSLMDDFFKNYPSKRVVYFSDDFKIQYLNPFQISNRSKKWNLFFLGWMTKSPHNSSKIISFDDFTNDCVIFMSNYNIRMNFYLFKSIKYMNVHKKRILYSNLNFTFFQLINSH